MRGGREGAAELVASGEDIMMLQRVDLDSGQTDQVFRLELRAHNLLNWVTCGRQSGKEQRMCERRGACEPAVEDEEAGAIAEDERSEGCLINYL